MSSLPTYRGLLQPVQSRVIWILRTITKSAHYYLKNTATTKSFLSQDFKMLSFLFKALNGLGSFHLNQGLKTFLFNYSLAPVRESHGLRCVHRPGNGFHWNVTEFWVQAKRVHRIWRIEAPLSNNYAGCKYRFINSKVKTFPTSWTDARKRGGKRYVLAWIRFNHLFPHQLNKTLMMQTTFTSLSHYENDEMMKWCCFLCKLLIIKKIITVFTCKY